MLIMNSYKAWAAIIINANATALLQEAVRMGNSSYDPMGAMWVYIFMHIMSYSLAPNLLFQECSYTRN